MSLLVADFDFAGTQAGELSFSAGARIKLLEASPEAEWWQGQLLDEQGEVKSEGFFPKTHGHLSSASPYDELRNKQRVAKRNVVLAAMLRSERDYIKTTATFIDSFVNPLLLLDTPFKRKLLADSSLSLLLHLVVEINAASTLLFDGITSSTSGESLAQTYRQFATTLPLYAQYITEIPQGLDVLKKHSEKLVNFISKMDVPLPLSAEDYLLEPLEHYTRYRADLQEFVWLTPPNAPELGALASSLQLLTDMVGQITVRADEAEASIKLLELQSQFLGQQQIFTQSRRLVKAGEVHKIRESSGTITTKRYYCHLFNDALLYSGIVPAAGAAEATPTFKLHKWIPLANASVRSTSKFAGKVSNSFTLTSVRDRGSSSQRGDKVDVFRCSLPEDATAWVQAIEKLLRTAAPPPPVSFKKEGRSAHLPGVNFGELGPRAACIYTFLDREMDFVHTVSKINRVLVQPLLRAAAGKPLSVSRSQGMGALSSSALGTKSQQAITADVQSADVQLFLHATEALSVGLQEFQQALQGACQAARWAEAGLVGGLFSSPRSRNLFAHYKTYSSKQLQVLRILHRPHFLSFYREADAALASIAGSSLAERLDLPRRHPSSYVAFLQSLLLQTPATHADHAPLLESTALLSELLASIDVKLQARQNFEKVLDIQSSLFSSSIFGAADDPVIEQLASPGRIFVKEGDLRKVCKHKNKLYRFWLFNDLLIYGASVGAESFAFHFALQVARCSAAAVPSDARALEVVGPGKAFIAIAPSQEARDDWVEKINAAKTALVGSSAADGSGAAGGAAEHSVATISIVNGADKCGICAASFSLFRRRHCCSRCTKAVCGEHSKKAEGQRVCLGCLTVVEPKAGAAAGAAVAAVAPSPPPPPPAAKPVEAAPAVRSVGPGRRAPPPPVVQAPPPPTLRPISYRRASIIISGSEAPQGQQQEQEPYFTCPPDSTLPGATSVSGAPAFKPPPPPPRPAPPAARPATSPLSNELMSSILRLQVEPMELRKAKSRFSTRPPLGGKSMMLDLITRLNKNRSKLEGSDDSGSDSDSDFD